MIPTRWAQDTRGDSAPQSEAVSKDVCASLSDEGSRNFEARQGTVIEVLVAWKERIISTHHFAEKGVVSIGSSSKADVVVPVMQGELLSAR